MLTIKFGDKSAYRLLIVYCILMALAVFIWNRLTDVIFLLMLLNCVIMLIFEKKLLLDGFLKSFIAFFAYSMLTIVWAGNRSFAVSTNISIIQRIGLAICVYEIVDGRERVEMIVRCLFLGGLFVLAYLLVTYGYNGLIDFMSSESHARLGEEITNANTIGITFAMAAISAWYFILKKNHWFCYLLCFVLFFLFIIASGSRTSFFGLIAGVMACSYFYSKSNKIFRMITIIAIIWVCYMIIKRLGLMPGVISRFDSAINSILGKEEFSGSALSRLEFADYGFLKIKQNPLFGYGAGQFRYYMGRDLGMAYSSHNNYVEVLFSYGIIGTGIWYGMYVYCIIKLWKVSTNPGNAAILSLLIMRMLSDITAHTIATSTPYLILALAYSCVRLEKSMVGGKNVDIQHINKI